MTESQLSDLFAEGTAPESDPDFALRVAAGIGRERLGAQVRALALRAAVVLVLSGAAFVAAGMIKPVLGRLVDGAPQFMGAPMPVVLAALAAGLAVFARRYVLPRPAGDGLLEPVE